MNRKILLLLAISFLTVSLTASLNTFAAESYQHSSIFSTNPAVKSTPFEHQIYDGGFKPMNNITGGAVTYNGVCPFVNGNSMGASNGKNAVISYKSSDDSVVEISSAVPLRLNTDLSAQMPVSGSGALKPSRTDRLYGACYIAYEGTRWNGIDYRKGIKLLNNLGVRSMRSWMHSDWLLYSPSSVNQSNVNLMKNIVSQAQQYDIEVIGMNHQWFNGTDDSLALPCPKDSSYAKFLADMETTWRTLARTFPEIKLWEVGNEWNNDDFNHPLDYKKSGYKHKYTLNEKAQITADVLYYASKGIHSGNPKATVIIGGLVDVDSLNKGVDYNIDFINLLYSYIKGGKAPYGSAAVKTVDSYFQAAAWHPYQFGRDVDQNWVDANRNIYNAFKNGFGHDIDCYLTEFGYSDKGNADTDAQTAEWMKNAYKLIENDSVLSKCVKSMHYFRMFNDIGDEAWSGGTEMSNFGLYHEAKDSKTPYAPKEKGRVYQSMAGGKGNLSEFEKSDDKAQFIIVQKCTGGYYPLWPQDGKWEWKTIGKADSVNIPRFNVKTAKDDEILFIMKATDGEALYVDPVITKTSGNVQRTDKWYTSFEGTQLKTIKSTPSDKTGTSNPNIKNSDNTQSDKLISGESENSTDESVSGTASQSGSSKKGGNSNVLLIVLCVVFIINLALGGIYLILKFKDKQ